MEQPDSKKAYQLFQKQEYLASKKILTSIKNAHLSFELNALLCDFKNNPSQPQPILQQMMDIRVTVNIKAFKEAKNKKNSLRPPLELYFWNILVLSQLANNPEVAQLIAHEALQYSDCMRTLTTLMMIYHSLQSMEQSSRLASCIGLIQKQNRVLQFVRRLDSQEQSYRFMNQIMYCKVLLKLGTVQKKYCLQESGMIEGSKLMYMMKFKQNLEQQAKEEAVTTISGIPTHIHQILLNAQIEYHSKNYSQALKLMSLLIAKIQGLPKRDFLKAIIDHNVSLILFQMNKKTPAILTIHKTLSYFTNSKDLSCSNQQSQLISKCKDNLLLASLGNSSNKEGYEGLSTHHNSYSFKLNYRKAQLCLDYYHQLVKSAKKIIPYSQIHDFYETIYYYPNLPYFQQKGKNKNPYHSNKKYHYRRYVVAEDQPLEQLQQEILNKSQWLLKQSLLILEKEKGVIVNLEEEQNGIQQQVNQQLHNEYISFKSSIYSLLCYTSLCQQQWSQTLHYATIYQSFEKQYQLHSKNKQQRDLHYNILTYKSEAYSRLNRSEKAYDLLHQTLSSIDYSDTVLHQCVGENGLLEQMTNYNNFLYNLAIIHSRQNKIPEAYNSIQKLLQQLRIIPTHPTAKIPPSLLHLLIHYNLRTGNQSSAIQLLKRRRILNLPGVIGQYNPTLNITK